jgi:hypothetical protein
MKTLDPYPDSLEMPDPDSLEMPDQDSVNPDPQHYLVNMILYGSTQSEFGPRPSS